MYKSQLESILKLDSQSRQNFKGVFAIDKLPKRADTGSYVINYDNHNEPGSHWVAVYVQNAKVEYFDSNGQPPLDKRLESFIGPDYTFNPFQLQKILDNACGFYCTYFILQKSRNCTSNDILKLLARSNGDFIVKSYLYNYFKPIFA